jgi:hypothetical protein
MMIQSWWFAQAVTRGPDPSMWRQEPPPYTGRYGPYIPVYHRLPPARIPHTADMWSTYCQVGSNYSADSEALNTR